MTVFLKACEQMEKDSNSFFHQLINLCRLSLTILENHLNRIIFFFLIYTFFLSYRNVKDVCSFFSCTSSNVTKKIKLIVNTQIVDLNWQHEAFFLLILRYYAWRYSDSCSVEYAHTCDSGNKLLVPVLENVRDTRNFRDAHRTQSPHSSMRKTPRVVGPCVVHFETSGIKSSALKLVESGELLRFQPNMSSCTFLCFEMLVEHNTDCGRTVLIKYVYAMVDLLYEKLVEYNTDCVFSSIVFRKCIFKTEMELIHYSQGHQPECQDKRTQLIETPDDSFARVAVFRRALMHAPACILKPFKKEVTGDISYLRGKLGLTVPTTSQVLASHQLMLTRKYPREQHVPPPPPPQNRESSSGRKSFLPFVPGEMCTRRKRRTTSALIDKAQIMADLNRNTLMMEKIMEYRRHSLTKKEMRGQVARHYFQQDGVTLQHVKDELALEKKKKLQDIKRRMSYYNKVRNSAKRKSTRSNSDSESLIDV
ncbi:hypothetical protein Btru_069050 [Bulinus truncatus]|nr:hypothetical protein Btru_069050 [Bulinus truncatus]